MGLPPKRDHLSYLKKFFHSNVKFNELGGIFMAPTGDFENLRMRINYIGIIYRANNISLSDPFPIERRVT